ncbi:cytochrome P450 [Stutzerimonas degradans]|uniref:Cytochrome P450 n=1 Tax=Stutzerimonas degradans TaxID=2968968 RepID=A0A8E2QB07_9GAMM|nr:cytochrome P450 [Stutzerimonas degradans]MCQ4275562.1 cytochrome P450 [Stutzerimonas degradans]PNF75483.1 cytochrome P450 [Stutzerimonas degradans]QPT22887.1 cytochrome P450 [Stutzerimonas degradans]
MENKSADWDPRSEAVLKDQLATYDDMRRRCPVATSRYGYTSLFRHADVMHVLMDHETYSNAVSRFPSVPNGMDPPEHTAYRRLIEPYFEPQQMEAFAPVCREVAVRLVQALPEQADVELMADFAQIFALQIQCAWLGWPVELHEPLRLWTLKNQAATLARDEAAMSAVALEFDGYIKDLLTARRNAGSAAPDDVTTRLLRDQALGRPLTDDEIVSILRNWTVGELGTIAASIGILVHYLAGHAALQQQLREQPALLPAAIDEILRIHAPLVMNRRVTTREVTLGERTLAAGTRLALIWASANRDEAVFGDPDEFRLDREPQLNLLYGAGIHVCPGAPLARLELRVVMEELLGRTRRMALLADQQPVKAFFPASGFSSLPLHIEKAENATPHG